MIDGVVGTVCTGQLCKSLGYMSLLVLVQSVIIWFYESYVIYIFYIYGSMYFLCY
jgi:hypothetical protein